jgi:hypothetical protein
VGQVAQIQATIAGHAPVMQQVPITQEQVSINLVVP